MTRLTITPHRLSLYSITAVIALVFFMLISISLRSTAHAESAVQSAEQHIITLHDDGKEKGFITKADTLREALKDANIPVDANDRTEPGLDEALVAASYEVNIYRARMVIVRDGENETKIITAYRTGKQIAEQAGLSVQQEDILALTQSTDIITDGAAEVLTINRATPVTFNFYGSVMQAYTQSKTVGAMLRERGVTMTAADGISPATTAQITAGMTIRLWRDGTQTITQDEDIQFETEQIRDANRERGYKEVKTAGVNGRRTVTYEVTTENGVEVKRMEINSNILTQPVKQVEVVGARGCANDTTANRLLGHRLMLEYGFGEDQWEYLDKLWSHESGWVECKANYAGSGAYGIPQALPGSKMGPGWQDDPEVQIRWGLGYIRGRYTNPLGAYNHWRSNNWY